MASTGAPTSRFWAPDYPTTDGWEDELDRFYDRCAKSELYRKAWAYCLKFGDDDFPPNTYEYYISVNETRGYDPTPENYTDHVRHLIDLEDIYSDHIQSSKIYFQVVEQGAQHALLHYNEGKSKTLEFVKIIKGYLHYTFCPANMLFFITFEAQEKGNPDTRKHYQTRVLVGHDLGIVKLCSFRPKP